MVADESKCHNCLAHTMCRLQAEPVAENIVVPDATGAVMETMQTTTFSDMMPGVSIGEPSVVDAIDDSDAVTTAGLQDFMKRPVRISTFTWQESDPQGAIHVVNPWYEFFNNANIKFKLNNYSFVRCDLKIKVVVNASPFYYGAARMCYQPLQNFTPSTIEFTNAGGRDLIPLSQQPGFWIKPQVNEGGEMILPFFNPRNFLRVQRAADFTDMGVLRVMCYAPLRSANGVAGSGVTVQIYAWADNITIAGPSVGLSMQGQDEYGTGVVSGPASTVARLAGMAKGIPIIGKFATATEMGAKAISGIAKLFGFTNVPVIADAQPYKPSPFPQLASGEIGYPTEKLTIDAKNELSIDPSTIGLPSQDELSIESLATRQSYLTDAIWSTATPVDTPLFTCRVNCTLYDSIALTSMTQAYPTPLCLLSQLFANWRGDVIFTFKFVASPFHKGRVRISYDPYSSDIQTTGDTGSIAFNTVVDLGTETDVDVRIPYQQALAWLRNGNALNTGNIPFSTSATPTLTRLEGFDNGILSMKVLTLLTAPLGTSTVPILIFVRGAENMEFANPQTPRQDLSLFQVQGMHEEIEGEVAPVGTNSAQLSLPRNRVNFGEEVRSVRQLLRRSNHVNVWVPDTAANENAFFRLRMFRWPEFWGYDPNAILSANSLLAPLTNAKFNFTQVMPWHLISPCFIAHKGSAHWHINVESPQPASTIAMMRDATSQFTGVAVTVASQAAGSSASESLYYRNELPETGGGTALTNQNTQSGLSVSLPNYTPFKFQSTNPQRATASGSGASDDGSRYEASWLWVGGNGVSGPKLENMRIHRYFGVGTDYNLYFFLNVPTWYLIEGTILPPV